MTAVTDRFNTQHPVVQFERVEDELKLIASENGCTAEVVQETRLLLCSFYGTPMPHTRSPQGWVCCCGELIQDSELGTHTVISGGEVLELGPRKTSSDELPF